MRADPDRGEKDMARIGIWEGHISCGFEFECFVFILSLELFSQMSPRALTI